MRKTLMLMLLVGLSVTTLAGSGDRDKAVSRVQ